MSDLKERIKKYSQSTALLLTASTASNAAIVYTDVSPDTTFTLSGSAYNVDLNNDANPDFAISFDSLTSFSSVGIQNLGAGNYYAANSGTYYALVLSSGSVIDNSNIPYWGTDSGVGYRDNIGWYSKSSGGSYGYWAGESNKFIGVKFDISGSTHFGWIRISVPIGYTSFTLHDYAYNDCPNDPIIAGITSGGGACLQAPMVFDSIRCDTGLITLNATPATGGVDCNWYETDTSSAPLHSGLSFTTSILGDTSFFVSTVDTGGNESIARTEVFAEVNPLPVPVIFGTGNVLNTFSVYEFYQWYRNNTAIPGADTTIYTPTMNGDYYVEVTDSFGCVGVSTIETVSSFPDDLGVADLRKVGLMVYPNPTNRHIYVESKNEALNHIWLYDNQGQLISSINANGLKRQEIDLRELPKGLYFLKVQRDGEDFMQKVIIE